jgi:Tfp pilus assembly protein FimT
MVVIVIIAILAVIAVPLFAARLQSRRVLQVAGRVADLYRGSRTRAIARGAAIVVSANLTDGSFQVLEGVQGTNTAKAGCANLPTQGCLTNNWGNVGSGTTVGTARVVDGISNQQVNVTMALAGSTPSGTVAICFSPGGRTYVNTSGTWTANMWSPLSNVALLNVSDSSTTPRSYGVLVLPNGTSRLAQ